MPTKEYNASLAAPGYGTWKGYCIQVGHGIRVVQTDVGARSRRGQAFYMTRTTSGSFGITFRLESEDRLREFNSFMEGYARLITNPNNAVAKAMTVTVPSRRFLKVAVPDGTVAVYGKEAGQFFWDTSILFVGTRDPLESENVRDVVSKFVAAKRDLIDSPWFYPNSTPLNGGDAVDDSLYNDDADLSPPAVDPQGTFRRDPVTGRTTGRNPGL